MNSVIVVEGIHDEMKIKSVYPKANVIITNGREISDSTLDMIKKISETNEIIIFTDPDSPGEAIRRRIWLYRVRNHARIYAVWRVLFFPSYQ